MAGGPDPSPAQRAVAVRPAEGSDGAHPPDPAKRLAGTLLGLAVGGAASLVLVLHPPLGPLDPLSDTLALVPILIAALGEVGRAARRAGARQLPRRWRSLALPLVVTWIALVLARPRLGLLVDAPVLAGGGALLLLVHTGLQIFALRPLLGERLSSRPSWLFFALPCILYLALIPWSTAQRPPNGDEPWYLLVTHSLAYDGDADLRNNYEQDDGRRFSPHRLEPQPGDPVGPDGELYSRHNELLPLALVPGYRLFGKAGALATMALMTALLAWMTLRLGSRYGPAPAGETLLAYGLLALTPPLLLYSHQVWVEVPAALLCVIALDRIRLLAGSAPWRRRDGLTLAAALLLLPLLKIRFSALVLPLLLLTAWYGARGRKNVLRFLLPPAAIVGLVGLGLLLFNQLVYGNPLRIHDWSELQIYRQEPLQFAQGLVGPWWDLSFGLFFFSPIWLLVVPALLLLLRRRHSLLLDLAVLALPYLLLVASRREWYGGWSPPFRYALVFLPLLALTLVHLLADRRGGLRRSILISLGLLTLTLTLIWVAVPGWTYNFADGRSLLFDQLSSRVGADVSRLLPSATRPRAATWILPPALTLTLLGAWWCRWPRRCRASASVGLALAALLGLLTIVPLLPRLLPTSVVEIEAPHVYKSGGHVSPPRWEIDRTRYREAWVLREGERVEIPVVTGGSRVELVLEARTVRNRPESLRLEIATADGQRFTLPLEGPDEWRRHTIGPLPWSGGPLVLEAMGGARGQPPNGVLLDRLHLRWRD